MVSIKPDTSSSTLLQADLIESTSTPFGNKQKKDIQLREVIQFLKTEELPTDAKPVKKIASLQYLSAIIDDMLYYIDHKQDHQRHIIAIA